MYSFGSILKIAAPIMVGSAVQNVIHLTDLYFLGRYGETELAAIGLVGTFYLIAASLGYSFSKGGQILIARYVGEGREERIGRVFYAMLMFELAVATLIFLFMYFGRHWFFGLVVNDEGVRQACIDWLQWRSFGIFFGYMGMVVVALYSGVARTTIIIYEAIALGLINCLLNYLLVAGNWGFPRMGMEGSGLASTVAEFIVVVVFMIYILNDRKARAYGLLGRQVQLKALAKEKGDGGGSSLFHLREAHESTLAHLRLRFFEFDWALLKEQLVLSTPIVVQAFVGTGSWFVFFAIVENYLGDENLAISNILRAVYLLFMIPGWGLSSAINTLSSNLVGKRDFKMIPKIIFRTAVLSLGMTLLLVVLLLLFPTFIMSIATNDIHLLHKSAALNGVLVISLILYSTSNIYYNGLVGTGATTTGLGLIFISVFNYLVYTWIAVVLLGGNLAWAWLSEVVYWVTLIVFSHIFIQRFVARQLRNHPILSEP